MVRTISLRNRPISALALREPRDLAGYNGAPSARIVFLLYPDVAAKPALDTRAGFD